MFQTKVVEKIRIHILRSMNVFRESCRLCYNVEKYDRSKYTTDENMERTRLPCRIKKFIILRVLDKNGYVNGPQCEDIRILPVLFVTILVP